MRRLGIVCVLSLVLTLAATPLAFAESVTLRLALRAIPGELEAYKELVAQFEAENPDIRVEIENSGSAEFNEKLLLQYASGVAPDVIYIHYTTAPIVIKRGMLMDLTQFIERDQYSLDDFFPATMEQLSPDDDTLFGLPRETTSAGVFYNMDHFDQAGLPYPDGSWTYDDLAPLARRLTRDVDGDGAIDQFGIRAPWGWNHRPTILWSWGGRFFDENGQFAMHEPEGVAAMQWIADLVYEHEVATIVWGDRFSKGRSSIEFMNSWHVQDNINNTFRWDATEIPVGPAGRYSRNASGAHGIISSTAHPEEAWRLVQFLSSTDGLAKLAGSGSIMPARRSAVFSSGFLEGPPANRWVFVNALEYAKVDTLPEEVVTALDGILDPVWKGKQPAAIALEEAVPVINALMAELSGR